MTVPYCKLNLEVWLHVICLYNTGERSEPEKEEDNIKVKTTVWPPLLPIKSLHKTPPLTNLRGVRTPGPPSGSALVRTCISRVNRYSKDTNFLRQDDDTYYFSRSGVKGQGHTYTLKQFLNLVKCHVQLLNTIQLQLQLQYRFSYDRMMTLIVFQVIFEG